jgi:hypothetical protein
VLLKRVFPSVLGELTDIYGEMATWEGDHITHFASESVPSDRFFGCIKDHAKATAESKRQRKRCADFDLVLDNIDYN